jgi:hypothetical protein
VEGSAVESKPERSADAAPLADASALTPLEREILIFERQLWKNAGAKEEAIRARFGLSAARYYQVLNATLELPGSLVFDPMLVKRLQRLRDARIDARSARILGVQDSSTLHQ